MFTIGVSRRGAGLGQRTRAHSDLIFEIDRPASRALATAKADREEGGWRVKVPTLSKAPRQEAMKVLYIQKGTREAWGPRTQC